MSRHQASAGRPATATTWHAIDDLPTNREAIWTSPARGLLTTPRMQWSDGPAADDGLAAEWSSGVPEPSSR